MYTETTTKTLDIPNSVKLLTGVDGRKIQYELLQKTLTMAPSPLPVYNQGQSSF